jgi:hypothetical protein
MRNTLAEHLFSASAPKTDMRLLHRYDRFVPDSEMPARANLVRFSFINRRRLTLRQRRLRVRLERA